METDSSIRDRDCQKKRRGFSPIHLYIRLTSLLPWGDSVRLGYNHDCRDQALRAGEMLVAIGWIR